jgi:recombination protein RecT
MASFEMVLAGKLTENRTALPSDLNTSRFIANSVALVRGNDTLKEFMQKYGQNGNAQLQIIDGLMRAAYLGLDGLNQEVYLIPYGDKLNFMPSYKGMVKLCMKYSTRPINTIYAKVVKEGDEFVEEIVNGQPSITFRPKAFNNGKMVGVFAVCLYKDGGMVYEVMSSADVEMCRKSSKASNSPAWRSYPGEMAKKTVLRRLAKSITIDMDENMADAMNAGLEIETDPKVLAEREIEEKGNSEELVVEATEVTT